MRIAVLSDIHDNVWNLDAALRHVSDCDHLICCGDLCSPFVIDQLARGFSRPIEIVWGNNDADQFRMTAKATRYPHLHLRGEFWEGEIGGRRIAVNHFDGIAKAIARGRQHDAVFFGHNHVFENTWFGDTLALNPGSIMGAQFDAQANRTNVSSTFAIYDAVENAADGYRITAHWDAEPLLDA